MSRKPQNVRGKYDDTYQELKRRAQPSENSSNIQRFAARRTAGVLIRHQLHADPRPACLYLLRALIFSKPQSTKFRNNSLKICRNPPALSVAARVSHSTPTPQLVPAEYPPRSEPIPSPSCGSVGQDLLSCHGHRFRAEDGFCATPQALPCDSYARQLFANRRRCKSKS